MNDLEPGFIYCPICNRVLVAANYNEVDSGEHDGYIYVHEDITHLDIDLDALETGIQ